MDLNALELDYLDIREFLYKFFSVDLNPIGIASVIIQLSLLAWIVYQIYNRLKGTQAERVIKGVIALVPVVILCYILKLSILTRMIEILSSTIILALIVIFAPEFRRVLMQLGGQFPTLDLIFIPDSKKKIMESINELIAAIKDLQQSKTGALIAIEKAKVDRYYVNSGHPINASLSKELLLTIFKAKTPLHDGAVTVRGTTINAAGVIMPMTENPKLDWQYGTRHRAAIGFSEVTDSLCVVVSEETGDLSIAYQGQLTKYKKIADIRVQIESFYSHIIQKKKHEKYISKYFYNFFNKKHEEEVAEQSS